MGPSTWVPHCRASKGTDSCDVVSESSQVCISDEGVIRATQKDYYLCVWGLFRTCAPLLERCGLF